jgi:hypothetical protein
MSTIKKLAETVEKGLKEALPGLRRTVIRKLALAVGAMIEERKPNTVEGPTYIITHLPKRLQAWPMASARRTIAA